VVVDAVIDAVLIVACCLSQLWSFFVAVVVAVALAVIVGCACSHCLGCDCGCCCGCACGHCWLPFRSLQLPLWCCHGWLSWFPLHSLSRFPLQSLSRLYLQSLSMFPLPSRLLAVIVGYACGHYWLPLQLLSWLVVAVALVVIVAVALVVVVVVALAVIVSHSCACECCTVVAVALFAVALWLSTLFFEMMKDYGACTELFHAWSWHFTTCLDCASH